MPTEGDLGAPLTYTFRIANQGPADASGVTLTDQLPSSVNFNSASLAVKRPVKERVLTTPVS